MLSTILSLAAPAILGPAGLALTSNAAIASAIGGGIGSLLQGGSTQDALRGAALGGLGGYLGGQLGGAGGASVDPNLAATAATPYGFSNVAGAAGGGAEWPSRLARQPRMPAAAAHPGRRTRRRRATGPRLRART